jgi:hypothetical protein
MTRKLTEKRIVVASHNRGKVREIADLVQPHGIETVAAADLDLPEPEETEDSFTGNALLKARAAAGPATDRLLTTSRGTPASPDYVRRKLHEAVRGSGIDGKVTPHMLRHTAATQYLECGVDMRFVQRLLGHSSIATTEIYTHVSDTALRSAVLGAGVRKRMGRTDN